jgi:prepilin-type N-terminal cleavage/methylation domain-containing protein
MRYRLLKKLIRNQQGFTLIETVVTLAISSFIISGTVISLHHMMFHDEDVREDMESTQFVQNTSNWIRRDVLMTQSIDPGDNPSTTEDEAMTLYWTGSFYRDTQNNDCINYYEVSYYIDSEELRRKEHVTTKVYNSNGSLIETIEDDNITYVADNIIDLTIESESPTLILSITALVGDAQTKKTYEVLPRAVEYDLE